MSGVRIIGMITIKVLLPTAVLGSVRMKMLLDCCGVVLGTAPLSTADLQLATGPIRATGATTSDFAFLVPWRGLFSSLPSSPIALYTLSFTLFKEI